MRQQQMRATMRLMLLNMTTLCQDRRGGPTLCTQSRMMQQQRTSQQQHQQKTMQQQQQQQCQQQARKQADKRLLWTSQHLQVSSAQPGASSKLRMVCQVGPRSKPGMNSRMLQLQRKVLGQRMQTRRRHLGA
jgi:hypothetical protein